MPIKNSTTLSESLKYEIINDTDNSVQIVYVIENTIYNGDEYVVITNFEAPYFGQKVYVVEEDGDEILIGKIVNRSILIDNSSYSESFLYKSG